MTRTLGRSLSLVALVTLGCAAAACNNRISIGGGLPGDDAGASLDLDDHLPGPADLLGAACSAQSPCPAALRCHRGLCVPDHGACLIDDECQGDTWCECEVGAEGDGGACSEGACIPWGTGERGPYDPSCRLPGFPAASFKAPVLHCLWQQRVLGGAIYVINTPLVADLDGDHVPEIVFGAGDKLNTFQRIVAIRSNDCSIFIDKDVKLGMFSHYAVGDLDGDKVPEIVGLTDLGIVKVFDNRGNLLATSPAPYDYTGDRGSDCSGPALANIDGVGPAEIVLGGQVLRYHKGDPALEMLFNNAPHTAIWGLVSSVADLDGDGRAEVIAGTEIYDGISGVDKTPSALADLGWTLGSYPAVADFNLDGHPDVALVRSDAGQQQLLVLDYVHNKILFGPYGVGNGGWGGPPTVADFDGDGIPDIGLASARNYYTYALKCARSPRPADCTGIEPGVLWQKDTHDVTSGGTGSSVFDFNGDGRAEVVYRDECWLRVYNGPDGKTLFAVNVTSQTGLEMPVIADVDNDGHADLVVSSDPQTACVPAPEAETHTPWSGLTDGVLVFRDPLNRWMPSRPLWNQHSYHITNINDDLTIPAKESDSWLDWNNYRQNVQLGPGKGGGPQGDLTGGTFTGTDPGDKDCSSSWTLRANLCNRGAARLQPGIAGTFYASDPRIAPGNPLCTAVSREILDSGDCEPLACQWQHPAEGRVDLWFRSDDDGTGTSAVGECKEKNNLLFLPSSGCRQIQ